MTTTQPIKELTLLFVRRLNANGGKEILLGLKKRGFGKGKGRQYEQNGSRCYDHHRPQNPD